MIINHCKQETRWSICFIKWCIQANKYKVFGGVIYEIGEVIDIVDKPFDQSEEKFKWWSNYPSLSIKSQCYHIMTIIMMIALIRSFDFLPIVQNE